MSLPVPTTSSNSSHPSSGGIQLDPKEIQALDAPLIALTNQCGGDLRRLFFAFFSFLNRRTDFYLVPHPDDVSQGNQINMGFREGDAEKLLLAAFRQFPLRRMPPKASSPATGNVQAKRDEAKAGGTPSAAGKSKSEIHEQPGNANAKNSDAVGHKSDPPMAKSEKKSEKESDNASVADHLSGVCYSEDGLQIPVGNGGSTKRYKWTQTVDECSVMIAVPDGTKGKDLVVVINPTSIEVKSKIPLKAGDDKPHTFVEGKLVEKIRADESTWSLEGGVLVLTLDKLKKTFWDTVIEGDEKIDTDLVDSKRHISEYDDATQGQIRKIIFDQNQERRGLQTSDEILGKKPELPTMPPGVEYIDQKKVDENVPVKKGKNSSDK